MSKKVQINYEAAAKARLTTWRFRRRLAKIKRENEKSLNTSDVDRSRLRIVFKGVMNG
ncbi:MAG: hypothetical protein ABH884_01780 [Candidatus Komeilibacteria bacterium]